MKKSRYLSIIAGIALLAFTSCSDFLDKVPDTRVYLTTIEQLRMLLVDGYMQTNYACVGELSSDNLVDNNAPSDDGVRYNKAAYDRSDDQLFAWEDVTYSNDNDTPSGVWSGCYGAIACANAVLEKVAEFEAQGGDENGAFTQEDKNKLAAIKGEALLIRAYHHWVLCNVFCMPYAGPEKSKAIQGIPYITKPENTVNPSYERGTLAENYAMIEKDLLEGLPLIDDQLYEVPKYHFNKQAANAFAARFYLWKRDYNKTVEYATAAFRGNDPANMLCDIWTNDSFYYISDIGRYNTSIERPNVWMCFASYSTWWRRFVYSTQNRYTCNREAQRATIQGPGPTWERCTYSNSRTKKTFAMHPAFNGYCGSAGGQEYGSYYAGNCFEQFEYTDKIAGIGYCHEIRAEFTTEQTLLDRAEALIFLGRIDEAFEDLNIWDSERQNNLSGDDRMVPLTKDIIVSFYTKCEEKYVRNLQRDTLTHYIDSIYFGIAKPIHIDDVCPSAQYHVTPEILPYLQCVQHFRRIETVHTGFRWFDVKRLGIELIHKIGRYNEQKVLKYDDPRRAIQIPYQVIAAGLEPNKREPVQEGGASGAKVISRSEYVMTH